MIERGIILALALLLLAHPAAAGGGCSPLSISGEELTRRADWALEIYQDLEASDIELAILARVGSDVSKYGLYYTHAGFVWRNHPKRHWGIVQMLNTCETDEAWVYDQGLLNFLLDDPFALDVLLLVPSVALQGAIARRLQDGTGSRFRHSRYSTLAYPFSLRYQNSNQWLLEVLAAAQGDLSGQGIAKRHEAQILYRNAGFRGSLVRLSGFEQALAGITRDNLHFDDHPNFRRDRGEFETTTVKALRAYLKRNGLLLREAEFVYPHPERFERYAPRRNQRAQRLPGAAVRR